MDVAVAAINHHTLGLIDQSWRQYGQVTPFGQELQAKSN
jgi:hypothetical protein